MHWHVPKSRDTKLGRWSAACCLYRTFGLAEQQSMGTSNGYMGSSTLRTTSLHMLCQAVWGPNVQQSSNNCAADVSEKGPEIGYNYSAMLSQQK